ncbi:beta-lactamase-like protein [Aspergillus avenaceus]|uniref:Beta-lactamase-like protein n=1 Tax=Aspergillus avenaceus TaxID=36643 RepID=A0A5N6TQ39_ASPAV|nr:beta-lactamase-like protein [Aspergillus avenaceus]
MAAETASSVVTVHALNAGHLTLPERFFVTPLINPEERQTVPSLSFLIQHRAPSGTLTRLIFDLGIRRRPQQYNAKIRKHIESRYPLSGNPDVVASLAQGNLTPSDIDCVIFSHVHWDHVGMPCDFPQAQFIVGHGSMALLDGSDALNNGSHNHFESDLLPLNRTLELRPPDEGIGTHQKALIPGIRCISNSSWKPFGPLPHTIDVFSDESVLLVDAPGHLPGHINLLCRVSLEPTRYVYLGGDACHDRRILTGEKDIAQWSDPDFPGRICCIHTGRGKSRETIKRIRNLEQESLGFGKVEVVLAHDVHWADKATRDGRFFPGCL